MRILIVIIFLTGFHNLFAQCEDNGNYWNESWVSCATSTNPNSIRGNTHWILYEFHEAHAITTSHIWNANRTGQTGRGVKDIVVDYSTDGTTWEELGTYEIPRADGSTNYEGVEGPNFDSIFVEKILITVLSTHNGGNCASIAEVRFNIDTSACYGTIDECGVCDGSGELTWYLDADEDGLGDPAMSISACEQPDGYVGNADDNCDDGTYGWTDVSRLFIENGCNSCHGNNASGGLDLRSYATTSIGGNLCGDNLLTSTHFVEAIMTAGYDGCGTALGIPSMNDRASGNFNAQELTILQHWVNGGAPEFCADFELVDADNDGFNVEEDCDDTNPAINPDAEEIPNNEIDEDCDGEDLITDIHQINGRKLNVTIFPNPVADRFSIQINGGKWNYQARLFDVSGKLLIEKENATIIDVSLLLNGTYFLELEDIQTHQKITEPIIVIK